MDNIQRTFIGFLKYYGIYDEFRQELYRDDANGGSENINPTFKNYLNANIPSEFINCAFGWSSSKRGTNFWSLIHYKWADILIQLSEKDDAINKDDVKEMFSCYKPTDSVLYDDELTKKVFASKEVIDHLYHNK